MSYKLKHISVKYTPCNAIENFPRVVVDFMLKYQYEQNKQKRLGVFERNAAAQRKDYGFDWDFTKEGYNFWDNVINKKNFNLFYEMYPLCKNINYKAIYKTDEEDVKIKSSVKEHLKYRDILTGFVFTKRGGNVHEDYDIKVDRVEVIEDDFDLILHFYDYGNKKYTSMYFYEILNSDNYATEDGEEITYEFLDKLIAKEEKWQINLSETREKLKNLGVDKLNEYAKHLIGFEFDMEYFSANPNKNEKYSVEIYNTKISENGNDIILDVRFNNVKNNGTGIDVYYLSNILYNFKKFTYNGNVITIDTIDGFIINKLKWDKVVEEFVKQDEVKERDLRLYWFKPSLGVLCKFGKGKTGAKRHLYNNLNDIRNFIESLKSSKLKGEKQFVVVEYLSPYNSKIIEVINTNLG